MIAPALPSNERERLAALYRYEILDTPPEAGFDRVVHLAAKLMQTPMAMISFVDADRQCFKAKLGLDAAGTERSIAFCAHAILGDGVCVVPDTTKDHRFLDNPLVLGEPGIRFYVGAPLVTPEGLKIGTLCVADTVPRPDFTEEDSDSLQQLAAVVMSELELRVSLKTRAAFLAHMNHEIRGPVMGIMSLADAMHRQIYGPLGSSEYVEFTAAIRQASENLASMVNSVLDYAKADAMALSLREEVVDLGGLVAECCGLMEARAQERDLTLAPEGAAPGALNVTADRGLLRQGLTNLVSNALKFTPEGGRVTVAAALDPCGRPLLRVTDTGIGIAPEELPRVMSPFGQAGEAIDGSRGTGLGLPLVKRLIELHRGTMDIDSALGQGTSITLLLPVECVAPLPSEPNANTPARQASPHRAVSPSGR